MNEDTCPDSRDLIRRIALKKFCSKLEAIESNQRSRKSSVRELHSTVINNGFPYSNPTAQDTGIAKRFAAAAGRFEGLPIPTPAAGPVAGGGQHA